jgi:hypothetical protein
MHPPPAQIQAPPAPPKTPERKSRLAQPPPPLKQQPPPPPPPQVAPKPKLEDRQVVLPQKPGIVPDFSKAPGCFDIVARGSLPRISFYTEIVM